MSKQSHNEKQGNQANGAATDQQKLVGALETLKEVMVSSEVSSLRSLVGDTKSEIAGRLSEAALKANESIDGVSKELSSRIDAMKPKLDSMEDRRQKEMTSAKEETATSIAKLRSELREAQEQSTEQTNAAKNELKNWFATKQADLQSEVDRLAQGLATLQNGLRDQALQSQQISGLLQNMGAVFASASQAPAPAESSIESALDEMFQEVETGAEQPKTAQD